MVTITYGLTRKIKDLMYWKSNPNEMNEDEYTALEKSLKDFGNVEPIVIAEEGEILGGNWRTTVSMNLFGDDYGMPCTEILGLTREQKDKLGLALNKIHGQNNLDKLRVLINSFEEPNELLGLGFSPDEMHMLDIDTQVFSTEDGMFTMDKEVKEKEIICPNCGFKIKGKQRQNVGRQKILGAEQF